MSESELFIGRVKWFNSKAGYGFITVTDGERSGNDVFVHHSAIHVENQQYKYLVQGEYVEFKLSKTSSGTHEWQACNVNGIKGGKLMCETRNEIKNSRSSYQSSAEQSFDRAPRVRGEGPRAGHKKEWSLVKKQDSSYQQSTR